MKFKRYYDGEAVVQAIMDISEAAHALYGCNKEFVYDTMLRKIEGHSIYVSEDKTSMSVIANEESMQ